MRYRIAFLTLAAGATVFAACGGAAITAGPGGTPPTATGQPASGATPPTGGQPGTATGAQIRVVNLYFENNQPVEIDVYAENAIAGQFGINEVLKATVPYGQVSAPFDPGRAESLDSSDDIRVALSVYRQGEHEQPLVGAASNGELEPGGMATLIVTSDEGSSGDPVAFAMFFFEDLRNFHMEDADPSKALLLVNSWGMPDSEEYQYASIGEACLENAYAQPSEVKFGQSIQPGAMSFAPMRVEPGTHQLTFHLQGPDEDVAQCTTEPLYPAVPIDVAAGKHYLLFLFDTDSEGPPQTLFLPGGQ